jgi:hypothetical protein
MSHRLEEGGRREGDARPSSARYAEPRPSGPGTGGLDDLHLQARAAGRGAGRSADLSHRCPPVGTGRHDPTGREPNASGRSRSRRRRYLDGTPHLSNLPWRFANVFALTPSSTHELRVDARDTFGNVSQSNVLSVATPAPTNGVAPTAPANVQLGFQSGSGEAWLSWDRSTDDADPQHLIVYEIYFNGLPNYPESIVGGNSTIAYCTVQGIGMTEVVLRAVDTSGNRSSPSNAVWVDC